MKERFTVEIQGSSHGEGVLTTIRHCPEGIVMDHEFVAQELARRRPGQQFTTPRNEPDEFEVTDGLSASGETTGRPLRIFVPNTSQNRAAYDDMADVLRPGHGITTQIVKAWQAGKSIDVSGGGQASARLTVGMVIAGAIAETGINQQLEGREVRTVACLESMGTIGRPGLISGPLKEEHIYMNAVRNPYPVMATRMRQQLIRLRRQGDSVGGEVFCQTTGYPGGIGERPGLSLDGRLMGAVGDIPAVKAVSIGQPEPHTFVGSEFVDEISGYQGTDIFTYSNRAGGILGGLSMGGSPINVYASFKPTGSLHKPVRTVNKVGEQIALELGDDHRHDPCVAIRGVEVVKAAVRIALYQAWLSEQT